MADKEKAKEELKRLIARYETTLSGGKVKQYNEERTKKDFILPLFKILGWATETEEVTAEDKVSKGRVDYGFRVNELLKLVVEAKPLRADLDKPEYAQQAVDYAWHKGISWAVLTNFEKIILFNADLKLQNPLQNAKLRLSCSQFLDRLEDLWLLSKDSVESGALEAWGQRYAVGPKKVDVGEQILADLMDWREWLTKDINKHPNNKKVASTEEELDESVQRILDRLIFIRTCEDREFEEKLLHQLLEEWRSGSRKSLFGGLVKIFEYFNENYDSKLFLPHSCDKLSIADEVIAAVIEGLYRTKDKSIRYDFSLIEADVLGSIYENYLGHVLRQTAKRVKVADTPNHRKQLGIYYTPPYIVDYIVKNTLGELLRGKKAEEIKDIKVLDPACGSGSFLIKAFDTISEAYKQKNGEELPFGKKKDILTDNIFGVDLDPKAVEIAQLNLMLKAVEKKKLLPMLQNNVKNGNSLIDDPAVAGDKAFKWEEQFKEIMKNGGFDVVVGNPPYVDIKQLDPKIVRHFFDKYSTVENRMNLYAVFAERALSLLKDGCYFGFIIPNSIFYNKSYQKIRALLLDKVTLRKIIRLPDNVFQNVKVETIILIYQKKKETTKKPNCEVIIYPRETTINAIKENNAQVSYFNQKIWETENNVINISTNTSLIKLLNKIEEETKPLIDICDFSLGLTPYDKYKGHTKSQIEERTFHSKTKKNATFKPLLSGENITRYGVFWDGKEYINYGNWLGAPREQRFFTKPRIVVRQIVSGKPLRIYAGYTEAELYNTQIAFNIIVKDENIVLPKYVLAILNSKLMNFYHKEKYLDPSKNLFQKILIINAKKFPIKIISLEKQRLIVKIVDKMLSLHKRLNEIGDRNTDEKLRIQEEIKRTDAEIDELVYKLYGITDDEKKVIEESLK